MRSIREMLNIATSRDQKRATICSAIKQLRTIEFYYHGGYRTVEPYCLGIVMDGEADNESLICYQTGGFSDLREVVGWKLYRESEMIEIDIMRDHFIPDRPGFSPDDVGMAHIICCVKLLPPVTEEITPPPPVEELVIESSPIVPDEPPPPPPAAKPLPVIRYLTHNDLMARFRFAHPAPIQELYSMSWPDPLAKPFPEPVESKIWPSVEFSEDIHYLLGNTA